jgi:hypothetical protein
MGIFLGMWVGKLANIDLIDKDTKKKTEVKVNGISICDPLKGSFS